MLVLRRQFLAKEDEPEDLFVHLNFDTHRVGYLHDWKRFYDGDWINDKPWMGEANTVKKKFEVSRTGIGNFKINFTPIVIQGEEVIEGNEKKIKLTYGVSLPVIIFKLLGFMVGTSIAIVFLGEWGFFIGLCLLVLNVLTTALELNKSEAHMTKYLNSLHQSKRE